MSYWTAASDFDAFPSFAGYVDANGIGHDSYEAACEYYGADTPAQLEAEGRYWAEIEEAEHFDRLFNDALVVQPGCVACTAAQAAHWVGSTDLEAFRASFPEDDECPF